MDLIDLIRAQAREEGKAQEATLNGIPIRVAPDGEVTIREMVEVGVGADHDDE